MVVVGGCGGDGGDGEMVVIGGWVGRMVMGDFFEGMVVGSEGMVVGGWWWWG